MCQKPIKYIFFEAELNAVHCTYALPLLILAIYCLMPKEPQPHFLMTYKTLIKCIKYLPSVLCKWRKKSKIYIGSFVVK